MTNRSASDDIGRPSYKRISHNNIVTFEFQLPLTNEDELRRTLDSLFYKDTLWERVSNIAPDARKKIVPPQDGESDSAHLQRAFDKIATLFWGYSISHVSGRFRTGQLRSQTEALGNRYLVDETTAVVRFIFPCQTGRREHADHFTHTAPASDTDTDSSLKNEVDCIRLAFLEIFVEHIVTRVLKEDEIWVLENAQNVNRLYIWEKR